MGVPNFSVFPELPVRTEYRYVSYQILAKERSSVSPFSMHAIKVLKMQIFSLA